MCYVYCVYEWTTTSIVSGQRVSIYFFHISLNFRELNENVLNFVWTLHYLNSNFNQTFYRVLVSISRKIIWYFLNCNIVKYSSQIMINERMMKLPGNLSHNEIVSISGYFWVFCFICFIFCYFPFFAPILCTHCSTYWNDCDGRLKTTHTKNIKFNIKREKFWLMLLKSMQT